MQEKIGITDIMAENSCIWQKIVLGNTDLYFNGLYL